MDRRQAQARRERIRLAKGAPWQRDIVPIDAEDRLPRR
jgi:hypothetical protein